MRLWNGSRFTLLGTVIFSLAYIIGMLALYVLGWLIFRHQMPPWSGEAPL